MLFLKEKQKSLYRSVTVGLLLSVLDLVDL